jgi:hypothetical protein
MLFGGRRSPSAITKAFRMSDYYEGPSELDTATAMELLGELSNRYEEIVFAGRQERGEIERAVYFNNGGIYACFGLANSQMERLRTIIKSDND